jgi:AcrR family transcriptional regulator
MPMTAVTKFDQRKEAIVRVATELMNHHGVRGMTLPLVAGKLDLVPRAVSYYFRRKEDLAAACYRRSIERMDTHISEALTHGTPREVVRAFVTLFFESQMLVQTGQAEPIAWFEEMRTVNDAESGEAFTNMFRKVRGIFSLGQTPKFDRKEKNARAHLLLSQMFWAVLWLPRYNPEDYARMAERTADILLNGMAAPGASMDLPDLALASEEPLGGPDFLRAATELINEEGYRGASVAKIAARLNVTKGSFYHHNQAKDALVEECFERTWSILRKAQASADAKSGNGLTNLAAQAAALVGGQVSEERPLLRTSALAAVPEEMRPRLIAGFDRITARYSSVVSDGITDGSIRPLDVLLAAQMISGAINAAAELRFWAPGLSPATARSWYVGPLFTGLLSSSDISEG